MVTGEWGSRTVLGYLWLHTTIAARCFFLPPPLAQPRRRFLFSFPFLYPSQPTPSPFSSTFSPRHASRCGHYREYRPRIRLLITRFRVVPTHPLRPRISTLHDFSRFFTTSRVEDFFSPFAADAARTLCR